MSGDVETSFETEWGERAGIVRISTAVRITGLSRSRIYELIQSGDLETTKVGRATLVQYRSLKLPTDNAGPVTEERPRAAWDVAFLAVRRPQSRKGRTGKDGAHGAH